MPPMPPATSRKPSCDGVGSVLHDCKLDLLCGQGNLNGPRYPRDILETVVVPLSDPCFNHVTSVY